MRRQKQPYLVFHQSPRASGVTQQWLVFTRNAAVPLGVVRWMNTWRRYAFFAEPHTIFEQDCLRQLADFVEARTQERKDERSAVPAAKVQAKEGPGPRKSPEVGPTGDAVLAVPSPGAPRASELAERLTERMKDAF